MRLGWDAYLDREIERHMGGEADSIEEEPAAPTTGDTACDICGARFDLVPGCECDHCHLVIGGGDSCDCDLGSCSERADGGRHTFGVVAVSA